MLRKKVLQTMKYIFIILLFSCATIKPHVTKIENKGSYTTVTARYSYMVWEISYECKPDSLIIGKQVNIRQWKRVR